MRYIRCFQLSSQLVETPNIYPYNCLKNKSAELVLLDDVTIFYGNNGSGKSTLLNLLATKLNVNGAVPPTFFGEIDYFEQYIKEMSISFEMMEDSMKLYNIPKNSRYLKSEDILYEIKKIQQETILEEGYYYERRQLGMTKEEWSTHKKSLTMKKQLERQKFAQEKYSNGETAMQIFSDYLEPDGLYLLDEPEASLSAENQVKLAEMINEASRLLACQFIIATHSPFLLGSLEATIYNLDLVGIQKSHWTSLETVKFYEQFFAKRRKEF